MAKREPNRKHQYTMKHVVEAPLRRLVGLLHLIDFETVGSCCGYDYDGQNDPEKEYHTPKKHIEPYIAFRAKPKGKAWEKMYWLVASASGVFHGCWKALLIPGSHDAPAEGKIYPPCWKLYIPNVSDTGHGGGNCECHTSLTIPERIHAAELAISDIYGEDMPEGVLMKPHRDEYTGVKPWHIKKRQFLVYD